MTAAEKSSRAVELLREGTLDELRRARLERRFLDAVASRPGPANVSPARPRSRAAVVLGLGAPLAAAAIAFVVLRGVGTSPHFSIEHASGGPITSGTVIDVGAGDVARAEIFHLELTAAAGATVRFAEVSEDAVRLSLEHGTAYFTFHPEERGRERVTIETPSATVEIVGTELGVRVDEDGTEVTVTEGRVRVVPTRGGEEVFVSGGERLRVAATATVEARALDPILSGTTGPDEPSEVSSAGAAAATEATAPPGAADEPALEPAPVLSPAQRYERADELLSTDRATARSELLALSRAGMPRSVRVDALSLLGDSYRDAHENERALDAYATAARIGRGTSGGALALWERASLLEDMGRPDEARAAFERYLDEYPDGTHAEHARARIED